MSAKGSHRTFICTSTGERMSFNGISNLIKPLQSPTTWSDKKYLEEYWKNHHLAARPSLKESITFAKIFLNWYAEGKSPNNEISDVITGIISQMTVPHKNEFLIPDLYYNKENGKQLSALEEAITQTRDQASCGPSFSEPASKKWHSTIFKGLDAVHDEVTQRYYINKVGFLCLIMMRLSVKEIPSVCKYISERAGHLFKKLFECQIMEMFIPPNEIMANSFKLVVKKLSPNCTFIMTMLLYPIAKPAESAPKVLEILKTGCLTHLELVGMGIYHWFNQAAMAPLNIPPRELLKHMAYELRNFNTVNCEIEKILNDYASPTSSEYTWYWARMIEDTAFNRLSTSYNMLYAATVMCIHAEKGHDNPMWKNASFKKIEPFHKERAIKLAQIVVIDVKKNKNKEANDIDV